MTTQFPLLCQKTTLITALSLVLGPPLQLLERLNDVAVKVGEKKDFTCHAEGIPVPTFRWLVNGERQSSGVSSSLVSRGNAIGTKSTFTISKVAEINTGVVTCVALHERNGDIDVKTSTANLIVLSKLTLCET